MVRDNPHASNPSPLKVIFSHVSERLVDTVPLETGLILESNCGAEVNSSICSPNTFLSLKLNEYWSSIFGVKKIEYGAATPPPAVILVVMESTMFPEESNTDISVSRSSKKAFDVTSKPTSTVSSRPSPSLSVSVVVLKSILAGEVILAASISIVP